MPFTSPCIYPSPTSACARAASPGSSARRDRGAAAMTAVHTIPFDDIVVGARMRQLHEGTVIELMDSIRKVGLLNPISVIRDKRTFHLIAGAHRLQAYKQL